MFQARDFIVTEEGLVFAVTLNGSEDGRVIACLRYVPEGGGLRKVATAEAESLLRRRYPQYLHYSPQRDVTLQAVSVERIRRHLRPRQRLGELLDRVSPDPLILRLQKLVALFCEQGLERDQIGITGSLLIGCHNAKSDLDVVLYGHETFERARQALRHLTAGGQLQPLSETLWHTTWQRRGCALDFPTWLWHERRKYTKGAIDGTKFDLMLAEDDTWENDPRPWRKAGPVTIRAQVTDAGAAFATPARYRLDHPDIPLALCFTATYLGQAQAGEAVEIAGQLEVAPDGDQRIIVGASREAPGEYIKVIQA